MAATQNLASDALVGRTQRRVVLLTGTERFTRPLRQVEQHKFEALTDLADHYVLAFSDGLRPRTFKAGAVFILLPNVAPARLRQALFIVSSFAVCLYLAMFRGMRVAMSTGVYDAVPLLAARAVARIFGIRLAVVVQIHGDWDAVFLLNKVPDSMRGLIDRLSRFVVGQANVVRTISQFTSGRIQDRVPQGTPRVVFPGFTDIDQFLRAAVAREPAVPGVLLFVGALTHLKGVHLLIHAMSILRGAGVIPRAIIAGSGPDEMDLRRQAESAGVSSQIEFVGFVEQDRLCELLLSCDALVLPTLSEGFGRVVIEAMACRRPVVASRTGGIPELIEDGRTGFLVEPGNAVELADKLLFLLDHPDAAQRVADAGWQFVKERYSNAAYFDHYEHLLDIAAQSVSADMTTAR